MGAEGPVPAMSGAARRYGRAVFELAQQDHDLEAWHRRLAQAQELLMHPEVALAVSNPTIPAAERMALVSGTHVLDAEATNLVKLLIESNRVADIDGIVDQFEALADEAAGRVRATVTTAIELPARDRERIAKELSERLNKDVRVNVIVDPRIIGGLKVQYGDRVVDASVSTKLEQLRRRLTSVS